MAKNTSGPDAFETHDDNEDDDIQYVIEMEDADISENTTDRLLADFVAIGENTSDYGTLDRDTTEVEQTNTNIFSYYSAPDLSNTNVLNVNVTSPKYFQFTPGNGTASICEQTANDQPEGEEERSFKGTIQDRTVSLLRKIRKTEPQVKTELFNEGKGKMNRANYYKLVIFKGSDFGCRFTAKMLFENEVSKRKKGRKSYYIKSPDEIDHVKPDEKAIILILDVNGVNGSNISRLDGWYEVLKENMPIGKCVQDNWTIIMTLNDFSEPNNNQHPILEEYSDYIIDAIKKEFRPSLQTRNKLFEAFLNQMNVQIIPPKSGSLSQTIDMGASCIERDTVESAVPLLGNIRFIGKLSRYLRSRVFDDLNILRKPVPELVRRIRQSYLEEGALFQILLAVYSNGGQLEFNCSCQTQKINNKCKTFLQTTDKFGKSSKRNSKTKSNKVGSIPIKPLHDSRYNGTDLKRYACSFEGEFLSEENDVYTFCDERVHYSFMLVYCEIVPGAILECESDFFYNFIKPQSSSENNDQDVFLFVGVEMDERTKAVMERFRGEITSGHVAKCMNHPLMSTCTMFFESFVAFLNKTPRSLWKVLNTEDDDTSEHYSCLYYGNRKSDASQCKFRNITEVISMQAIWKEKRKKPKWKSWVKSQESETLVRLVETGQMDTFKCMIDNGAAIPFSALKKAIAIGNEECIDLIVEYGHFSQGEWYEGAKHAADKLKNDDLCQSSPPSPIYSLTTLICKCDLNKCVEETPPFIHYAVSTDNLTILKMLVDGFFGPIDTTFVFNGETPLWVALRLGFTDIATYLLDARTEYSRDVVFKAASLGMKNALKYLLEREPDLLTAKNDEGFTPFFLAVIHDHEQVVHDLLQCNESKSVAKQQRNRQGQTALHVAAQRGHTKVTRILLSHRFDLKATDKSNDTPLSLACSGRHVQIVRIILSSMVTGEYDRLKQHAVMKLVQEDKIELLEVFYEYNCTFNFDSFEYGSPLNEAVFLNRHDIVHFLLSKDADVNMISKGYRPVHIAAIWGDVTSFRILAAYGANIRATTDSNLDIIQIAEDRGHTQFVEAVKTQR